MTDAGSVTKMKRTVEGIDTNSFETKGPNLSHLCVIRMLNCHKEKIDKQGVARGEWVLSQKDTSDKV